MGFYLRKSLRVGPLRFNLSKSGIGVSTGIKGFRVGTGPRGNYVHMGRGGVYYRKTFSAGSKSRRLFSSENKVDLQHQQDDFTPPISPNVFMAEVESADVTLMEDSTSMDLLREFYTKQKLPRFGPWMLGLSILLLLGILFALPSPTLLLTTGTLLTIVTFLTFQNDRVRKSVVLMFQLDPTLMYAFSALHDAATKLSSPPTKCWHVSAMEQANEISLQTPKPISVARTEIPIQSIVPKFLKTNIEVPTIPVGKQQLYFFPDRLLVYDHGKIGAISYSDLKLTSTQVSIIEKNPPTDALVLKQTWQYANKDGEPDKRYRPQNNLELFVCLYDQIHFTSTSGLNEVLMISRVGFAQAFQNAVAHLSKYST